MTSKVCLETAQSGQRRKEKTMGKMRIIPKNLNIPLEDPDLALAVTIALSTALRVSEIVRLNAQDLLNGHGVKQIIKVKVKGGRRERVYLTQGTRLAIEAYLDGRTEGPLFIRNKRRWSRTRVWEAWHKAQVDAGVEEPFRFHDLRHTAITRFYERYRDIEATRVFARHSSIVTTQIYTHIREDEVWEMMERKEE